jgi:gentisate 1,2-dioxygenase
MIWLDVLDLPTVNFFDAAFSEHLDRESQANTRESGDSLARYGSGVLPDGAKPLKRSPIINYPYAHVKPVLERLEAAGEIDPRHGARVRYANPFTGGWVTPTMGAHLALLPKGFKGREYRSTDATIFVCAEGRGATKVEGETLEWGPNDVFVVPSWKRYAHAAKSRSVLFSISDRPAQEALGLWREEG